ncbi:dicer-like protein (DUF936) [Rhynchospora pubera]|uniref:Dicer-like protein (DUF936) n=1 Tax=Rhynchospora pubera TaxID=906938 RepID=A0AAV8HT59_9POAL|nr:dicer-like protein (DUF936) [Rhynchospora pubera]
MTSLAPGIVKKLLDGMKSGVPNPMGDHRTALLQVTDIVPVDLDEKALWPKHGFYVKLSDSTDSVYTSLPADQSDLVMSNKIQLGQFINLDRLEPGLPVPVIAGCRPLPGRHPLVGTPDPVRKSGRIQRRGSWDPQPGESLGQIGPVKPATLDFGERTPAKDLSKVLRKSCVIPKMVPARSKSVTDRGARVPRSPFFDDKSSVASTPGPGSVKRAEKSPKAYSFADNLENDSASVVMHKNKLCSKVNSVTSTPVSRIKRADTSSNFLFSDEKDRDLFSDEKEKDTSGSIKRCKSLFSAQSDSDYSSPSKQVGSGTRLSLPGKLSTLGKDAIQKRDAAQKAAHKALRDASATENVVRILKMLSDVNRSANPDNPSQCFEKFLSFHEETVQAIKDIETIQAATSMSTNSKATKKNPSDLDSSILQEIAQNTRTPGKRKPGSKPANVPGTPDTNRAFGLNQKSGSAADNVSETSLKMVREIQEEAGSWFVDFLEVALESGLKKAGQTKKGSGSNVCPQSVMLRVVNWIEMEQKSDDGKRRHVVHPKASQIARKLRIRAKNP